MENSIDCRSNEGELITLIDSVGTIMRILSRNSQTLSNQDVIEALKDMIQDKEVQAFLTIANQYKES